MYKLGRGGGGRGSGGKRPLPPAPQPRSAGGGRLPIGGGSRGRPGSAPSAGAPAPGREESFSLSSSGVLDFGAIIRLTPDLIDEIRRVEAQGGGVRIKFANSAIPNGNVIDVDGKEFGFTWSRDELCDIYEERQSGEGGDGLLVERGSAWRKLNVLRILDESTKKHVKKRSEEAERLHKSRKSIVLDSSNPSMKSQAKKMAAAEVEGNMRRMGWKQKKEPFFKKQKAESNQVSSSCPPKSVYKSGSTSTKAAKGIHSLSPTSSPPEQPVPGSTVSSFATGTFSRENINVEEINTPVDINKEHIDVGDFEKEMPKHKAGRHKGRAGSGAMESTNSNTKKISKGMSLKANAAGEKLPDPAMKNDNIFTNIEPPDKYLNVGGEVETSKRKESENASSPESAPDIATAIESIFGDKDTDGNLDQQAQPTSKIEDPFEKIDIMQDNPDPLSNVDKKHINDSEGRTSSSDSGSDSDSESDSSESGSDSGSQSRSRSKSRSPVGSASASSSDSESDGSSSSKEGSDVDVDIMTSEDEKGVTKPNAEAADLKLTSLPRMRTSDGEQEQIDILGDQEEQVAPLPIDLNDFGGNDDIANTGNIGKDFPCKSGNTFENLQSNFTSTMVSDSQRENSRFLGGPFSPEQYKHPDVNESFIEKTVDNKQPVLSNLSSHEQLQKPKTKKVKPEDFKEKPESTKKSKGGRAAAVMPYGQSKDAEWGSSKATDPQEYSLGDHSRSVTDGNAQKIHQSPEFRSSSSVDAGQLGTRAGDISARRKPVERFNKISERMPVRADAMPRDKIFKDSLHGNGADEKASLLPEYNRKLGEYGEHLKDKMHSSQMKKPDGNRSPVSTVKGSVLRRELSDLELGELREPPGGSETGGTRRQPDWKQSKSLDNEAPTTYCTTQDMSKGRGGSLKKQSPYNLRGEVADNHEGYNSKMLPDDPVDTARGLQRIIPSHSQHPPRMDNVDSEVKSYQNNSTKLARRGDMGINQEVSPGNHVGPLKKNPTNLPPQHDVKQGGQKGHKREPKQHKSDTLRDSTDRSNNGVSIENETNGRKRKLSAEDDNSFFSKYVKEIPDLRDPIKDFSQYNDYVQEFREKYDCYISLNENLENIRNDFLKVGRELELAKGRNLEDYYKVVDELREMYHHHGERNKMMKRVFMVLHEELKTLKQRIRDFVETHTRE